MRIHRPSSLRLAPLASLTGAAVLALAACSGGEGAGSRDAAVVTDSAGVRFVTSSAPIWKPGEEWRLSAEPKLEIGTVDGPPETQLFQVSGAVRLPDGRIVVAAGPELRWFDAGGGYLFAAGGAEEGSGPGELSSPYRLRVTQDGDVLVFDFRNRKTSRFGPDGAHLGDTPFDVPSGSFPVVIGFAADGTTVYYLLRPSPDVPAAGQVVRDSNMVVVAPRPDDADAERVEIGPVPADERLRIRIGGNEFPANPAIGHRFQATVGDDVVYVGDDARWEIRRYGLDGTLRAVMRRTGAWLPLTQADFDSLRASTYRAMENNPAIRDYFDAMMAATPRDGNLPAFSDMSVDAEGNLWVLPRLNAGSDRYLCVFAPDGRYLGDVALPDRFYPTDLGEDYVLGVSTDELDVQDVRLYGLEKPGSKTAG